MKNFGIDALIRTLKGSDEVFLAEQLGFLLKARTKLVKGYSFSLAEVLFVRYIYYKGRVLVSDQSIRRLKTEINALPANQNIEFQSDAAEKSISPEFFKEFVTFSKYHNKYQFKLIEIQGAFFPGYSTNAEPNWSLDLEGTSTSFTIAFSDCTFSHGIRLYHGNYQGILFNNCIFKSTTSTKERDYFIYSDYSTIVKSITFRNNTFKRKGLISMKRCSFGKGLQVHNAKPSMFPSVTLKGSVVAGSVGFEHCRFDCDLFYKHRNYRIEQVLKAVGLFLDYSVIEGSLTIESCEFGTNEQNIGLSLHNAVVKNIIEVFNTKLHCQAAIVADNLRAVSINFCSPTSGHITEIAGDVMLSRSEIGGDLNFSQAKISASSRELVVNLQGTTVFGDLLFTSTVLKGTVYLSNIVVQKMTVFSAAKMRSKTKLCIKAESARFCGAVTFSAQDDFGELKGVDVVEPTEIHGGVSFFGSTFESSLDLSGASYECQKSVESEEHRIDNANHTIGVDLASIKVERDLYINRGPAPARNWILKSTGTFDLRNSSINVIQISPAIFVNDILLLVSGTSYNLIVSDEPVKDNVKSIFTNSKDRICDCRWFKFIDGDDCDQPYEQLAKYFNRVGNFNHARRVRFLHNVGAKNIPLYSKIFRVLFYYPIYLIFSVFGVPAYKSFFIILMLPFFHTLFRIWPKIWQTGEITLSAQSVSKFFEAFLHSINIIWPFVITQKIETWNDLIFKTLMSVFLTLMVIDLANWNRPKT